MNLDQMSSTDFERSLIQVTGQVNTSYLIFTDRMPTKNQEEGRQLNSSGLSSTVFGKKISHVSVFEGKIAVIKYSSLDQPLKQRKTQEDDDGGNKNERD